VLRVVIGGSFVAASTYGGTVSLWSPVIGPVWQLAWTVAPTPPLARIYALAIAQIGSTVWVGGGGNGTGDAHGAGRMFVVQSVPSAEGVGFTPTQLWSAKTTYPPNPASYLDAGARYLTAADGEPAAPSETPGQFYLFDARTGTLVWTHETSLMNWAMTINAAGTACVGGSDDGSLYYWGAPNGA
jgi:outer membrane protein assembly factor BamB